MTLLPIERMRITVPKRQLWVTEAEPREVCARPGCRESVEQGRHHIVRRSETGGPVDYVAVDGFVMPNTVRVCTQHHNDLTGGVGGHRARIVYKEGDGWVWYERIVGQAPRNEDMWFVDFKTGSSWRRIGKVRR